MRKKLVIPNLPAAGGRSEGSAFSLHGAQLDDASLGVLFHLI
jgi:hypothetical protein